MSFIKEGNSASGSITKSRDVRTQAVFSLRGKPLNCFALTKQVVYENEEFNLLQAALNIAVVTNTIPNTGISLPFFSSGGTSLMMLLGEMGIVLSVSRQEA